MKSKQCLDVQQMQHLQELGIDTSNASASWYKPDMDTEYMLMFGNMKKEELVGNEESIPAYTLQDVLDALPIEINTGARRYWLRIDFSDKCLYYYYEDYNLIEIRKKIIDYSNDDNGLIDAAYKLLTWAIENGYVKTNKNE